MSHLTMSIESNIEDGAKVEPRGSLRGDLRLRH